MLKIISAKVTASPGDSGWVQVHGFSPAKPEETKSRGQLFAVVASKNGKEGIEAISFEREVVKRLREEYYNSTQEKTFDALKSVTEKVTNEFSTDGERIEIVCCAFADGVVYSSAFGGGSVLISRDGALASILESGAEVVAASGFPKAGDMIVAGTKAFFEKVTLGELKSKLIEKNPESAVEGLTPLVYGGIEIGTAGAIIIKFEQVFEFQQIKEPEISQEVREIPQPVMREIPKSQPPRLGFLSRLTRRIPRKNIYIKPGIQDEAISHSRKLTLSVGVILLLVLVISIGFGIRQKRVNDLKKEYQGLLSQATSEVDQAISLASADPERSRQLFLDSEQKLAQIQALKVKDPKIEELQKKVGESRAAVLGEYTIEPELFLDLGLLSSGFKGDSVSSSGGSIYVLDKAGSRVVSIAVDTKKSKVVAGPTVIENPIDMASYEDNVFVLFSDGIYLVGSNKTKVIEKTWSGDALIHSFAGNLYVLDKAGNAVFRYSGLPGNTFGSQQSWLSSSTRADFSGTLGWGMNGAIYVLYPNSRILKYSLGSPQGFSISGVSPEIGNVDALSADPDNQYVYLLDKAGKRVVVVDKNGKYKAQYINEQISGATRVVVSEAEKKIILLTGEKLLSIEIKHI
ncbi:hypothetical protein A2594_02350 [Candidatus Woesebacteria bacterium RIFOXYD1_FULL_41_28]|uniref:PPM-type phosphatase domain-containing protein n=3 Tax=Candidatus Woeseibacteriota TaxID=1752722 RepID=A0A0G0Z335_9BACT|nr:MAG: hypothetical protein UU74_C0042G0004 [Candidatus Woesebacteria bacterium GW2011_GWA1_41_7]OGM81500.1 MAG: hypothetical protein A2393_00505 [Candidatus Woesebacteria bacterium RIFOXYB1_FULL_41_13]OGM87975.1 MAG: hypothetical protein A2594_02350 [Candidatus Woesebacteria bacterium RIFOXYD1_FULL_41_28]